MFMLLMYWQVYGKVWTIQRRQQCRATSTHLSLLSGSGTPTWWNSYKMAATVAISEGASLKPFNLYIQGQCVLTYAGVFVCAIEWSCPACLDKPSAEVTPELLNCLEPLFLHSFPFISLHSFTSVDQQYIIQIVSLINKYMYFFSLNTILIYSSFKEVRTEMSDSLEINLVTPCLPLSYKKSKSCCAIWLLLKTKRKKQHYTVPKTGQLIRKWTGNHTYFKWENSFSAEL